LKIVSFVTGYGLDSKVARSVAPNKFAAGATRVSVRVFVVSVPASIKPQVAEKWRCTFDEPREADMVMDLG
jgi:hypothetical protein